MLKNKRETLVQNILTLPSRMLKNDKTCFKHLVELRLQDFKCIFGHFPTLRMKGVKDASDSCQVRKC